MSTIEITCGSCTKSFRVRREFSGRSTRCPNCSAPLTVAVSAPPVREEREPIAEPVRRRPPEREDFNDEPRRPKQRLHSKEAALACRREQLVLILLAVQLMLDGCAYVFAQLMRAGANGDFLAIAFFLLLGLGPGVIAGIIGLTARVAAMRTKEPFLGRGTASISFALMIGAGICLASGGIGLLIGIDRAVGSDALGVFGFGGALVAITASVITFGIYAVQVGSMVQSKSVARACGYVGGCFGIGLIVILVIGGLYALLTDFSYTGGAYYGGYYRRSSTEFFGPLLLIGLLITLLITLFGYYRLLGAVREAVE